MKDASIFFYTYRIIFIVIFLIPVFSYSQVSRDSSKTDGKDTLITQSVFEKLAEDPYLKRYGQSPGEGWIPLFETPTEIRFTGFIQLAILHDFQDAGFPYEWFVPALISVPTLKKPNTQFDIRASRIAFETRTNTKKAGSVKSMVEVDFYGNLSNPLRDTDLNLRLRQAYVTWVGPKSTVAFTMGQAWTTFIDLEVWPEILDMQGPNAMTGARQGLIRGSFAFNDHLIFAVSIEQPATLVQNGIGLRDLPDLASKLNWRGDWGHLQISGIARQLLAESTEGTGRDAAFGYGFIFSGGIKVPGTLRDNSPVDNLGSRQDLIQFQLQGGSGIGRYVNDLTTNLTPGDAVYQDEDQTINPIPEFGWFAAYHHWWTNYLRSQIVYSVVNVDNLSIESDNALHITTYALVNLAYTLFERMDICVEYLYGQRENKNGEKGHANRIQVGFNYGF